MKKISWLVGGMAAVLALVLAVACLDGTSGKDALPGVEADTNILQSVRAGAPGVRQGTCTDSGKPCKFDFYCQFVKPDGFCQDSGPEWSRSLNKPCTGNPNSHSPVTGENNYFCRGYQPSDCYMKKERCTTVMAQCLNSGAGEALNHCVCQQTMNPISAGSQFYCPVTTPGGG